MRKIKVMLGGSDIAKSKVRFDIINIKFKAGNKKVEFEVVTNLKGKGYDVSELIDSWVHRAREYTPESFCEYVVKKHIEVTCVPKPNYDISH